MAIALLALLVHYPGVWGEYTWDDDQWLTDNAAVQRWETFFDLWIPGKTPHFFPLVTTSFWIEHKLWGLGVVDAQGIGRGVGYHVTNLLLHMGASVILFAIVRRMKLPGGELGAWLAGAIFAVHPVNVETVAWVAERKNTLCAVFLFGSAFHAFRVMGLYQGEAGRKRDQHVGVTLFLCAMLSKTTACFLPPALLVLAWWKRGTVTREDVKKTLPYFVIAVGLGVLSVVLEKRVAGTEGPAWDFSPAQRFVIAGNAFWFYVQKLFVPYPVHQIYERWPIEAGKGIGAGWLWVRPALFVVVVAALVGLRKRLPRGPLAALLLFAGALFPTLGFISFYTMLFTFVADHYGYLAVPIGIVFGVEAVVWGVEKVLGWVGQREEEVRRQVVGGVGAVLITGMGFYAYGLSGLYRDGVLLWGYAYSHNGKSHFICLQYAMAWLSAKPRKAEYVEYASGLLDRAMELNPEDWRPWHAKGTMLEEIGRKEEGARYLEEAERRRERE